MVNIKYGNNQHIHINHECGLCLAVAIFSPFHVDSFMCIVQYVDMVGNNIKTMHNKKLNVTQGNISYINLRTKKERTNRSSFAFFDVGQKSPISYNLKH